MNIYTIGVLIIAVVSLGLKMLNIIYIKRQNLEKEQNKKSIKDISLLSSSVSYEQFKKVAKESSVLNSPIRTQGDFLDFVIENICFSDEGIEGRILTLNYGEENGR